MKSDSGAPDRIVFHNCRVWCGGRWSGALAIRGGFIERVGSAERLRSLSDKSALWIDLEGATVLPGFVDSHLHLDGLTFGRKWVNLKGSKSAGDAVSRLAPAAARIRPGGWLLGRGWDSVMWDTQPSLRMLDEIRDDIGIVLVSNDGHAAWTNSLALKKCNLSGISGEWGGLVVERKGGRLTGVVKENAVEVLLSAAREETCADEPALIETLRELASLGIVGVHDFSQTNLIGLLSRLEGKGKLPLRVRSFLPLESLAALSGLGIDSGFGSAGLKICGIKAFIDGSLTSRTALMIRPYRGGGNEKGVLVTGRRALMEMMDSAFRAGLMLSVHAIGDMANRIALDSYEKVKRSLGRKAEGRFRVEHAQLLHPSDIPRFAKLGVIASMQPIHAVSDMDKADLLWGRRVRYSYAWNSLLRRGTRLVFGSDAPVESPDPLAGIHAAVTRSRDGRKSWVAGECVTRNDALHAYTLAPAEAEGEGKLRGSIREGKSGDLAIVSGNVLQCETNEILSTEILATISSGRISHVSSFLKGKLPGGA